MNESKATRYQRSSRRVQAAAWALAGVMLALTAFTPVGRWLYLQSVTLASAMPVPDVLAFVLFITIVVLLCEAAVLPAVWYGSRRLDLAYGRGTGGLLKGRLLGALVALPVAVAAGAIVWGAGWIAGGAWWVLAGLLLSAGLVLAIHSGPVILTRLAPVRPLDRPALSADITDLARRAGVPVAAIQELVVDDASPTVAMVAGMGAGRRVLVASDVAQQWSDDEVAVVVAHELAHHVHHDLLRAWGLNAVVLCAGLWAGDLVIQSAGGWLRLGEVSDPAALPVIAFVAWGVWMAATPLRLAQSRRQERLADRFALALTGHAEAFATAVRRASAKQLAEDHPSQATRWFYHRHPSIAERLELAEAYKQATGDRLRATGVR